ncbi:MAG: alkaline phosphatase [Clostridia bacterium]|nr:alkaline phosphatase [Clostridia bacterium]
MRTREQLENVKPGDRIWGKLPRAYYDVDRDSSTPNLSELVKAAITALDDGNEHGFFLMVEGKSCIKNLCGNETGSHSHYFILYKAALP